MRTILLAVSIPAEQYGRLAPMVMKDLPVTIEADIAASFAFLAATRDERLPRKPQPPAAR